MPQKFVVGTLPGRLFSNAKPSCAANFPVSKKGWSCGVLLAAKGKVEGH